MRFFKLLFCVVFVFFILARLEAADNFQSSLEVFQNQYIYLVKGKKVGLLTNPTAVDENYTSIVDIFRDNKNIDLRVLFAPEHGVRGEFRAGVNFDGYTDKNSKLKVYSLHDGRKNSKFNQAVREVDVVVYAIQDIGIRTYTYVWQMEKMMRAVAANKKTLVILDVPNILGNRNCDGPLVSPSLFSGIGPYPVAFQYGLTSGELARYLNAEYKINCKLVVIPMKGYDGNTRFEKLGQPWVPTSQNIPSLDSAYCYGITGVIGPIGAVGIGVGTQLPFQVVYAPWIDGVKMANYLNSLRLPGIRFRTIHFSPQRGLYADKMCHGVQLHVTDPMKLKPFTTSMAIICYLQKNYTKNMSWSNDTRAFDIASGNSNIRLWIKAGRDYKSIVNSYRDAAEKFNDKVKKYRIYK
ncbi:MAG: DUF1343 domain-containing protein [Victivallaceae bacterium]